MTTNLTISTAGDLGQALDLGQAANRAAALNAFGDYRTRKAANTLRRQDADLALFAEYLAEAGLDQGGDLAHDAAAWWAITWGLVEGFVKWQLLKGYAVGSVNVRLSTVKTYAKLAAKAGTLQPDTLAMIRAVSGYSHKEAKRIDDHREAAELPTRNGDKKAEPVSLTPAQAQALKAQPDTPQGRRDRLIMALLLDGGRGGRADRGRV
jgi:site-specific recombinase XerD